MLTDLERRVLSELSDEIGAPSGLVAEELGVAVTEVTRIAKKLATEGLLEDTGYAMKRERNGSWQWIDKPKTEGGMRSRPGASTVWKTTEAGRAALDAGMIQERPMSKKSIKEAKSAGAKYASEQIQSEHFENWVLDQLAEASRMDPSEVLPLKTKDDARKIARNMLQQLGWDMQRQGAAQEELGSEATRDQIQAFYEGVSSKLQQKSVRDWLADWILTQSREIRGSAAGDKTPKEASKRRSNPGPNDENRKRLASYIAHLVMYERGVRPIDLVKAYHVTDEEAQAILARHYEYFGPGGKGYTAFAMQVEKALRKKEWYSAPEPKEIPGAALGYGRYVWLLESSAPPSTDRGRKDKSDIEDLQRVLDAVGFNGWGLAIDNWPEAQRYYNAASSVYRPHRRNADESGLDSGYSETRGASTKAGRRYVNGWNRIEKGIQVWVSGDEPTRVSITGSRANPKGRAFVEEVVRDWWGAPLHFSWTDTVNADISRDYTHGLRENVDDYIAVDRSGSTIAGPFKRQSDAKQHADRAGGHVEYRHASGLPPPPRRAPPPPSVYPIFRESGSGVHFQNGERVRIRVIGPEGQLADPPFWYTITGVMDLEDLALQFSQTIQPGMFVSISNGKNSWTFQKETHAGHNAIKRVTRLPTARYR